MLVSDLHSHINGHRTGRFCSFNLSRPQRLLIPTPVPRSLFSTWCVDSRECGLLLGLIEVAYPTHEPGFASLFPGLFLYLIWISHKQTTKRIYYVQCAWSELDPIDTPNTERDPSRLTIRWPKRQTPVSCLRVRRPEMSARTPRAIQRALEQNSTSRPTMFPCGQSSRYDSRDMALPGRQTGRQGAFTDGTVDLSGLCQRRFGGADGPNHARCQFIHYRRIFRVHEGGVLDRQRLLHVSPHRGACLLQSDPSNPTARSTSTVGQLIYGRLSDIWSRKVVLLAGLAIFFFGSLASSLAQSVLQLTVFRAFTGIGGGGLMTVAQLIVSDVVPLRERGKYQGILVSLFVISAASKVTDNCLLGRCCRNCQWHWSCYWWCSLVQVKGVLALDLSSESAIDSAHDVLRCVYHAAEEGSGRLEAVSHS